MRVTVVIVTAIAMLMVAVPELAAKHPCGPGDDPFFCLHDPVSRLKGRIRVICRFGGYQAFVRGRHRKRPVPTRAFFCASSATITTMRETVDRMCTFFSFGPGTNGPVEVTSVPVRRRRRVRYLGKRFSFRCRPGCSTGADCRSGICEGEGCPRDPMAPRGVCVPRVRGCLKNLAAYCGCNGQTFHASGSCPGRRFERRGECKAD